MGETFDQLDELLVALGESSGQQQRRGSRGRSRAPAAMAVARRSITYRLALATRAHDNRPAPRMPRPEPLSA
jgi:hypothetical protein